MSTFFFKCFFSQREAPRDVLRSFVFFLSVGGRVYNFTWEEAYVTPRRRAFAIMTTAVNYPNNCREERARA